MSSGSVIISSTCARNFRMLRDIRAKYFDLSRQPASTMIQVGMLTREGALYEVDVVAVLPPV